MVDYTMSGEHGGSKNDNKMTFQDVADVGNTEKPMMIVEKGVNNNDNNMPQTPPASGAGAVASSSPKSVPRPQTPLTSGAGAGAGTSSPKSIPRPQTPPTSGAGAGAEASSSPKYDPRPPSPPPCPRPPSPPPATKTPTTIHRMLNSYEPKMKSSDVGLFLKVLRINLNGIQHLVKNHLMFKYSRRHQIKSLYPAPLYKNTRRST
jgi:hypothetical protein